jgi:hypothetical protein
VCELCDRAIAGKAAVPAIGEAIDKIRALVSSDEGGTYQYSWSAAEVTTSPLSSSDFTSHQKKIEREEKKIGGGGNNI